jgi:hypothetical protein
MERTRGELLENHQNRREWRVHASSPGEAGTATASSRGTVSLRRLANGVLCYAALGVYI